MNLSERLRAKGWTGEEIEKAMSIMYGKKKDFVKVKKLNELLYWALLIVAIIGNFVVCVALIPVMLVMETLPLLLIILLTGISFGSLFAIVLKDIQDIDPKSHVIAGLFLPALAIIIMYVVTKLVNNISAQVPLFQHQNIIIIPLIYVISFISPYLFSQYAQRRQEASY